MDKLQPKFAIGTVLLWVLPIMYQLWYKILDVILPREIRLFEKGDEIIHDNKIIDFIIDIMVFFRAFHILYFFLYIAIITVFKNTYKLTTAIFVIFQAISIVFINYIYAKPQSLFEVLYSMCYFVPFYFIAYVLNCRYLGWNLKQKTDC